MIRLQDVTPDNIRLLKRINDVIYPVRYNDKFYKDLLKLGELAKLAYYEDEAVGAVCCRVDWSSDRKLKRLYIMSLGCISQYRRVGIGRVMLEHILKIIQDDDSYKSIYLHVQTSNSDAIAFYEKFGFEIVETCKNYYRRIESTDAYILQRTSKNSM